MSPPKNYITQSGHNKLLTELNQLLNKERPHYVQTVTWAASNGDRSENADYQYGKKKLREIDRRIHFITKRLEISVIVDPTIHIGEQIIYFGARVTILRNNQTEQTITIVGIDEINPKYNHISWISPLARAILGKSCGDSLSFHTPSGVEEIEILEVDYNSQ